MPGAGIQRARPVPHLQKGGVHLQEPNRYSHHHKDRECGEAREPAEETERRRWGKESRRAAIYSREDRIDRWWAGRGVWRKGLAPSPSTSSAPPLRVLDLFPCSRTLFPILATRGRAAPCKNCSKGGAGPEEKIPSGTSASLRRPPTTCQALPRFTSFKTLNNSNPLILFCVYTRGHRGGGSEVTRLAAGR